MQKITRANFLSFIGLSAISVIFPVRANGTQLELQPEEIKKSCLVNRDGFGSVGRAAKAIKSGEDLQVVLAILGDSFVEGNFFTEQLSKQLHNEYGFAGMGWFGFSWYTAGKGNWNSSRQPKGLDAPARSDLISVNEVVGDWECLYNIPSLNTPGLALIQSSSKGSFRRFSYCAGHSAATIFHGPCTNGVIRISWDDGASWGPEIFINKKISGFIDIEKIPVDAGVAKIVVVSGHVSLAGIDLQGSKPGFRIHKIGASGGRAQHFAKVDGSIWGEQLKKLNPNAAILLFGTNDQASARSPVEFAGDVSIISSNLTAMIGGLDILLVMPAENQRLSNTVLMTDYARTLRQFAVRLNQGFLDLQCFFGSPEDHAVAYSALSKDRPLYSTDRIHPNKSKGGSVIANAIYGFIF